MKISQVTVVLNGDKITGFKQFKENDAFRAWLLDRMFERAKEIAAA